MVNEMVVLYPGMGVGHLAPMVELAKLFIREGFSVTMVIIDQPDKTTGFIQNQITYISSANPSINFHTLPLVPLPTDASFVELLIEASQLQNSNLLSFLSTLSCVRAIVIDFLCTDVLDVASQLRIPAYISVSSPAVGLSVILYFPFFHSSTSVSLKDMGEVPLHFPGTLPMVASDMPETMLDRNHHIYNRILYHFKRIRNADGILLNTFEWFDSTAVNAIKDGLCIPDGPTPPIYCIGPVASKGDCTEGKEKHGCLAWLDKQPKNSVVFLCFGSMGTFSVQQQKEIAIGLENSGQKFIWVVRNPTNMFEEPNLDVLLPQGFLDRTKFQGMVVKSRVPQVEVLQHAAVGGFVTHCGWNSILEAIMAGVPMICWPLYAEQRMNMKFLVEEAKVAISIKGYDKGLVHANEVEAKIRWLMESKGGKVLRNQMAVVRDEAMEAVTEGGQSWKEFRDFSSRFKLERE
jgi:UDP-glucoronosyl and UDP-glucosyl transferase